MSPEADQFGERQVGRVMGQYRQWLHYREIDQKLQAQLEHLEQELAQFQGQARLLSSSGYTTDNAIIEALTRQQQAKEEQYVSVLALEHNGRGAEELTSNTWTAPLHETISPALFGWSQLPNFDAQEIEEVAPGARMARHTPPTPPIEDLLPEEVTTFVEEQAQSFATAPAQIRLPWWLNNTLPANRGPIDQQSIRTNQLVQRWLERWRKQDSNAQEPQKGQVK